MRTMDARETARLELQERLDTAKTQAERNRLGQFATPPELASEIISYADSLLPQRLKIRFLEPGFGTGPFYSALQRHVPPSRIEAAAGYEIDAHYAEPATTFWKSTGLRLHIGSFTEAEPPRTDAAKYNLIVCNPPYVRHHHLSQTQKRELQAAVARYLDFEMNGLALHVFHSSIASLDVKRRCERVAHSERIHGRQLWTQGERILDGEGDAQAHPSLRSE